MLRKILVENENVYLYISYSENQSKNIILINSLVIFIKSRLSKYLLELINGQHSFPSFLKEDILDSGENHHSPLNFTLTFNIALDLIKHINWNSENKMRLFRIT